MEMKKAPIIATIIGTGFGAGFWPWGPGTAGALLATLMWLAASFFLSPIPLFILTLTAIILSTILGTWATARLQPFWGDDPSQVVVDEMVGVWTPLLLADNCQQAIIALVLFRFFDIVKPLGIRILDNRKGAFWVMADDLLAGIYSAIVLYLIIHLWKV